MINWNVLWELTKTDFKLKYTGTVMGFVWSLLKPLSMLGALYIVFTYFFNNSIDSYALFLLLGIILWNYFVDATSDSIRSIKANKQMLTKTNLTPSIVVMSACLHSFITFTLNLTAFAIIFFASGKTLSITALLFIPLIIILFFITTAVSHILIILSARFTDFKHLWEIFIQIGFWITPIIYEMKMVPLHLQKIILANPLAQIMEYARKIILYQTSISLREIIILIIITLLLVLISAWTYKKNKLLVVDNL